MDYQNITTAMAELQEEKLLSLVQEVVDVAADAGPIMTALREGMEEVGRRFESGEYFLGELMFSGELMTEAVDIVKPLMLVSRKESLGKLILCTVKGDIHDIGKNIVRTLLEAAGFDVVDLGINVPPEEILKTVKDQNIHIVAMSGVLTLALDSMRETIELLKKEGLKDQVKVIIGGNPVSAEAAQSISADDYAHSPQKTVDVCKQWAKEVAN